jgi:serine/threonine protein kinase
MMSEYKIVNDHLIFKELNSDSIGVNYRAGEIEDRQASKHVLLTEVYPFISGNPDIWKRVSILMEGIKKSNIPNLYSPEKIIKEEDAAYLVYPYIKGQTFEKVLEDSSEKDLPINFDLTFSIGLAIADLIDTGSSIVVSGQKSFHGFLTPDNIIIDYDGKIYLKNYGIFPYLSKTEELYNEMINKYGAWVTPEFLRKERLAPQSDIYHLGYIIYRILTGEYFSLSTGEDFDAKFSNIRFSLHIPSSDKDFLTNLITFFKKTLHPDPAQRFGNMKEFKDFIAHFFHIEELSSVTFSLAYFMNSIYLENMDKENKTLKAELDYSIPEPEKAIEPPAPSDSRLAEDILAGLDEGKGSKMKIIIPIAAVALLVALIAVYFVLQTQKAAKERQQQQMETIKAMESRLAQLQQQQETTQQQYQEQMKELEEKKATTEEEQKAKEDEIKRLKEWREEQQKKEKLEQERIQKEQEALQKQKELADELKKQQEEAAKKKKEEEEKKRKEEEQKLLEAERNKIVEGALVPLSDDVQKPEKQKGKDPAFPTYIRTRYAGNKEINIRAIILIDEKGVVKDVRIISKIPDDISSILVKTLKKWEYKPAMKNNVKVKVWLPVSLNITF